MAKEYIKNQNIDNMMWNKIGLVNLLWTGADSDGGSLPLLENGREFSER